MSSSSIERRGRRWIGNEKDRYRGWNGGLTFTHPSANLALKACGREAAVRKSRTVLTGAALFVGIASQSLAASTPKGECPNLWKMYGLFMRASLQCNFPESNAIRKTMARIKATCASTSEQTARKYVSSGFAEFDKEVKKDGHPKACGSMYTFMDTIGQ